MRRGAALLVLAVAALASSPAVAARRCSQSTLAYLEAAIEGNRLIQADRMLTSMRADCGHEGRYRGLAAQVALRTGRFEQALDLFTALIQAAPTDAGLLSGAGRAALMLGREDEALALLTRGAAQPGADWRAYNALGVVHDRRREWEASARAYERALQLAPDQPGVINNRGYSMLLQGRPAEALPLLERAFALDPQDEEIRRNRTLALAMVGTYDDRRRPRESARDYAVRLNNLGYAAWLAGNRELARSLLTRAIEASDTRFERAERNLARVEGRE